MIVLSKAFVYFTSLTLFSSAKERKKEMGCPTMLQFLMITYALEQALMKLGSFYFEETGPRDRLDRLVKDLKEVLPSVQDLIQDTEERVVASRLSGYFLDFEIHVLSILQSLDRLANHDKFMYLSTADDRRFFDRMNYIIQHDLEKVYLVLNLISQSLESIRYRQQLESRLGVTSDGVKIVGRVDDVLKIVGRVDDVLKIVEFLMGSSTNHQLLHVFPIVGMAGLGKTALARSVCEKVSEGQLFDKTVWISVSDNFEELTVLREMLKDLGVPMAGGADSIGETLEHLSKELQGKRFLLVLDDVWNEDVDKWDGLKKCLLEVGGSNGSAVLVTTRSGQAASIMETFPGCRHDLKRLSDGDCWSIIREKVSGNEGEPLPLDLEVIGKEIASKCGGVPLVAHFLGEMCSGKERGQWLSVKNSCLRDIPGYEDIIIPILKKSFYHLPSRALKLCFAYCSIFSQDIIVEKEQLIQLWMAQGFLVQSNDQRMEDTGEVFFNKFVDSSFVEVVECRG
ncbi:disease resistance protein [Salix suchowensis]|nr:disease resistance protein [Salix suchowensis]